MKKILFIVVALLLSCFVMAGSFVKISYSGRAELEKLFADPNLMVHHYTDKEVFATAAVFDANTMVMIDERAFEDCEVYTLLYDVQGTVVAKGPATPYKNDGAVAIFNKKAVLPRLTRDFPVVTEVNDFIREMMAQVNQDSLQATVQHLQDYDGRYFNSTEAYAASDWIAGKMEALGLEVEQQGFYVNSWAGSGQAAPNVIGIQRGTLYPEVYVVCGSHLDSFTYDCLYGNNNGPGADDNATGVASVLESARIMSQYQFEYSIIYCAFGAEELGLYGSEAYASRCQQEGMDIIGYFNNDMNGYLWGDVIHIDCIYPSYVAPIGDYYMNVANIYFPEMPVQHVDLTYGDSDHTSFNNHGYMGIYPFEDVDHESPYIHTTNDLIGPSVTSFAMSQRYCQMNIGCLAEIANPVSGTPIVECNPVEDFHLVYPEPAKEISSITLEWSAPLTGSTGELVRFDVYRDNQFHASVNPDEYLFKDTISVDLEASYYVMAVYDDECEAPSETLVGVGVWDGVNETGVVDAQIYPNPVEGDLTIQAEGLQRVVLYNQLGQQVASLQTKQSSLTLPMNDYPKGIYLIRLVTEKGVVHRNVIVK